MWYILEELLRFIGRKFNQKQWYLDWCGHWVHIDEHSCGVCDRLELEEETRS